MSDPIISVRDVSKRYKLGQIGMTSFRDEIERLVGRFRGREKAVAPSEFWALKDINFDIQPGEIVGVIGGNGAGKSTLLKILSRITEPTSGEITMHGRIGSLLEVGTGFHPELSGRDNIYLNGAILGMSRAEVTSKFDAILDFSEVGKFIDTPVKRYSSGMYVRLAFAVAAHLEPEILIVDEVLAVGDVNFQRKCIGKMHEVSHDHGRTILFVSHNMNAVESLCSRCICLRGGKVIADGTNVHDTVRTYLGDRDREKKSVWTNPGDQWPNDWFKPERMSILAPNGQPAAIPFSNASPVRVVIEGEVLREDSGLQIGLGLFTSEGELLFWSTVRDVAEPAWPPLPRGRVRLECELPARLLNEGSFRIDLFLGIYHRLWICEPGVAAPSVNFEIQGGLSESPFWIERRPGVLGPVIAWKVTA